MSSWRECKLGDVLELKYGKDHKALNDGNIPVFGSGGIMRYSDTFLYDDESILIPRKGTLNNIFYINEPFWTVDTIFWSKINKKEAFGKFLFYQLKTIDFASLNVGSAVPSLTTKVLNEVDISLPPLEEQKAIAEVLSSLDDKIDLLHRQNQTLESLAGTLFRQWFIEEAKEEWEIGKLGDYIDIVDNRGKTPPISDDVTKYPIIEVNALSGESRLVNYSVIKKHVTEDVYNSWFRAGHPKLYDTLLSTVGSIGEIAMFLLEKGSIAQNIVALRAKNISPFYLYENIKFMQNELKELDIGSVQPSIKVTHLVKIDFVKPDDEILKKFDEQMMDISNKVIVNSEQIQILENLRDTLLPKLLNGEVRVEI